MLICDFIPFLIGLEWHLQLGVLWCLREDYEIAAGHLEKSLQEFKSFVEGSISNEKCIYETDDLFADEEALKASPPFYHQRTRVLDQVRDISRYLTVASLS